MTWQSWAYLGIFAAWVVVEAIALAQKDRPGARRTATANLRWLVDGAGWWHQAARALFLLFLGWFGPHVLN